MEKTYQQVIINLVDRIYDKKNQKASRKILADYFAHGTPKKKLTLEELGKNAGVTRQRAEQIRSDFIDIYFPAELQKFEIQNQNDQEYWRDLQRLRFYLENIVDEIRLFEKPIFAYHVQQSLQSKGVLDRDIYIPAVIDLTKSFGIKIDFEVEEFNEFSILVNLADEKGKYTKGILEYAKRIARHCCGLFSIDKLIDEKWNEKAPKSLKEIPFVIRKEFILDILHTDSSLLPLQHSEFYAFRGDNDRNERISGILAGIFFVYKTPIEKSILINSIKRVLEMELKRVRYSRFPGTDTYIEVLKGADWAIDEYCQRTLLLEPKGTDYRVPGRILRKKIENFQPKALYKNQICVLEKIKENGKPLDSNAFGRICAQELKIPKSQGSHIYSYPALYYRDGERGSGLYKTLNGNYSLMENKVNENSKDENDARNSKIKAIMEKIKKLRVDLENMDTVMEGKARAEQNYLRDLLIITSQTIKTTTSDLASRCQICNKYYPNQLLVAAHVKPRAKCCPEEKIDLENIAMLQCKSCDSLFENGFISVNEKGQVISNTDIPLTDDLVELLSRVEGNSCDYINGNMRRAAYMKYHRENVFSKVSRY